MKARKSRSAITKIEDPSCVWIDDAVVQHLFVDDFQLRFKSSPNPFSLMVNLPIKVSLEYIMNLIRLVDNNEIKEAVF